MSVEGGMTSRARVEGEKRGEPMSQWTFGGGVSEGSHVVRNAPWNFVGTCAFSVFREIMGYTGALDLTPPSIPRESATHQTRTRFSLMQWFSCGI